MFWVSASYRIVVLPLVVLGLFTSVELSSQSRTNISYEDAKPVLDALRAHLPPDLRDKSQAEIMSAWPIWVAGRDTQIRARLETGDEDSVVNFLLLGTTFTKQPRVLNQNMTLAGLKRADTIVRPRVDDLVAAAASPGDNERLQFARHMLQRKGIDVTDTEGRARARQYLAEAVTRTVADVERHMRSIQSAQRMDNPTATFAERLKFFSSRGLSSDTSILPAFALDRALAVIKSRGGLPPVRRVAIVGPGLDFIDKADGYDVYPLQTLQPFLAIDSLIRLELARPDDLRVTSLDVSPRVNQHLEGARLRARAGNAYALHLPRDTRTAWHPDLLAYWRQCGGAIGEQAGRISAAATAEGVEVRRVHVRPNVVATIDSRDLNIVLQRPEPFDTEDDRFDLVVATNILVYYDLFEQALALANVAAMLEPGGMFLSNNALPILPAIPLKEAGSVDVVYSNRANHRDRVVWYQRQ